MTTKRRRARIKAVILLYQSDLLNKNVSEIISNEIIFKKRIDDFTIKLVYGVEKSKNEIDDIIKKTAENWTLERLSLIHI